MTSPTDRTATLADLLAADGFAASVRPVEAHGVTGLQLCQGHCPIQHVAAEFPQFCDAETEAFSQLLGVHVQRLATLAAGDHVCTTFVPTSAAVAHSARPTQGKVSTMTSHIEELNPGLKDLGRYEYGWADSDAAGATARRGLSEDVVARHLRAQERAAVDARPAPEGAAAVRQEADADAGAPT